MTVRCDGDEALIKAMDWNPYYVNAESPRADIILAIRHKVQETNKITDVCFRILIGCQQFTNRHRLAHTMVCNRVALLLQLRFWSSGIRNNRLVVTKQI